MGRPPDHTFKPEGRPTSGASEPLGESLAASFADGTVRIYGPGGDVRNTWKTGTKGFGALRFSPDGKRLVGGRRGGGVDVMDSSDGRVLSSFPAAKERIDTLAVSRDAGVVVAASGSEVSGFRSSGVRLFTASSAFAEVTDVAVSRGGDRVAVGFTDVDVRVLDASTGRAVLTIADLDMAAFCLAFSPDGRLLACGCADGRVSVREVATGARVRDDVRHAGPVGTLGFSPDGAWVASVGLSMNPAEREASVRITSVSGSAAWSDVLGVLPMASLGFSADGIAHVTSPGPEGVRVWDVPTTRKD